MPFERPTNIGPSPTGAELGASPLTGAESAHAAATGAQAHMAAEVAALSNQGTAAVGHAALAAVPAAGEPISPIIQMIMKMPGATGLMNSFFEFLSSLFFPAGLDLTQLIGGMDPALFNLFGGGGDVLTNALQGLGETPLMNGLNMNMSNLGGGGLGGFDANQFGTSSVALEHFKLTPGNVGAQDLSTAQFEGVSKLSDGAVAGPSVSNVSSPNFLSGNNRLFSDQIGGRGFTSVTSATNVPTTSTAVPSTNGVTFGQEAMPQAARIPDGAVSGPAVGDAGNMQLASHAQPTLDATSSVGDKVGNNLMASNDVPSYRPSMGEYYNPTHSQGVGEVAGLKAKALSFEDLRKGVVGNHASRLMDQIADGKQAAVDHIGHQTKVASNLGSHKAFSTGHSAPELHKAAHHHHAPTAKSVVAQPRVAEVRPQVAQADVSQQAMPQDAQMTDQSAMGDQSAVGDQTQIAQATDQPATYTVEKGDSLWNIAKDKLGDGSKWTEIYNLNKDVLGNNPDLIFSGTELKLPGMTEVADAGKYIVQPGDNLWSIAKNQLGDASKWGDLYKANAEVIGSDARLILPGQEISLPGAGESVASAQLPNIDPSGAQAGMAQAPTVDMNSAQAQAYMQQMPMQQAPVDMQAAAQQQMMQQAVPAQQMPANTMGSMPAANNGVITVQPAQELPMGPGAAGASGFIKPIDNSVVSSTLAPDLSFLGKKPSS